MCQQLGRTCEQLIKRHDFWNAAHLAAVQKGDLGTARCFDLHRFEAADNVRQAEDHLKHHLASHQVRVRTAEQYVTE